MHIVGRQPVEQLLHCSGVRCPRRADANLATVSQPHVTFLGDRIWSAAAQLLLGPDEPSVDGGLE